MVQFSGFQVGCEEALPCEQNNVIVVRRRLHGKVRMASVPEKNEEGQLEDKVEAGVDADMEKEDEEEEEEDEGEEEEGEVDEEEEEDVNKSDKEDEEEMKQKEEAGKMEKGQQGEKLQLLPAPAGYEEHVRRLDQHVCHQDKLIHQLLAAGCVNKVNRVKDVQVQTVMCGKHFTPEFRRQTDVWYRKQILAQQAGNVTEFGSAGVPSLGETLANAHAATTSSGSRSGA